MELSGVPLPTMDRGNCNLLEKIKKFKQHAELMFDGALKDKTEEVQITYLFLWFGERGREIFRTLTLTPDQRKSLQNIFEAFQQHLEPSQTQCFQDSDLTVKFRVKIQSNSSLQN